MPPKKKGLSPNALLALGLAGCAGLVVVALVLTQFFKTEPPPPPPPPPPAAERTVTGQLRYTEGFYKAALDDDFKRFKLTPVSVDDIAAQHIYLDESPPARKLKADRDAVETPHLKLATRTVKEWASTGSSQGFRYEHIVLEITNKTDKHLAYHVVTEIEKPEKCRTKGALSHNAIALAPGETVRRTECLWRPGAALGLKQVEVMELLPLGYHYVSRLVPSQILLDERTASGHTPTAGRPCGFVPWRDIQAAAAAKTTSWADVIDFYARHNCDEYSFFRGYHMWTSPGRLPAVPTAGQEPAPGDGGAP